jgi:hypothetical protein
MGFIQRMLIAMNTGVSGVCKRSGASSEASVFGGSASGEYWIRRRMRGRKVCSNSAEAKHGARVDSARDNDWRACCRFMTSVDVHEK